MRRASLLIASLALCLCQSARAQGTVSAWGANFFGELGNGTFTTAPPYAINTPGSVSGLIGVTAIAGGAFHSLGLKSDGTVWAWGDNRLGQLGNGTFTDSNTPVQVLGPGGFLTGMTALAVGSDNEHSLALKSDGTVWAWGDNQSGQLGNGTVTPYPYGVNTPVQVLGPGGVGYLTGVTAIAGGLLSSLALKSDGTVWDWGSLQVSSSTPVQVLGPGGVGFFTGVTAIAQGITHSLALKNDGTVWIWELGLTPVQVFGLSSVTAIAAGAIHDVALKSDGTVWAWGDNESGQLGNGTFTNSSRPVQVLDSGGVGYLTGVTAIAAEGFPIYGHSLALKAATPPQAINSLIGQVISPVLGFSNGQNTSLTAKLQAALGYLQVNDTADAVAVLQAFVNRVNALVNSRRLSAADAAPLISAAEGIIAQF